MGNRVYQILALACITLTLSIGGLAAYLGFTGRLNAENVATMVKMLRGQPLQDEDEGVEEVAMTLPSGASAEQVTVNEEAVELANLQLDRRRQEIADQSQALRMLQASVAQERENLREARMKFLAEYEAAQRRNQDAGFRGQLELYESMQPKLVKEVFMGLDEALAAQYLSAMDARMASKVLTEFKTDEEKLRMQRLLELMRTAG
jgi:flagellar motility protein MotE (MotC chaperone)